MSTPRSRANSISARAVKTPSASPPARASAALSPCPSAWPKAKLRDCGDEQVKTRSPSPKAPSTSTPAPRRPRRNGAARRSRGRRERRLRLRPGRDRRRRRRRSQARSWPPRRSRRRERRSNDRAARFGPRSASQSARARPFVGRGQGHGGRQAGGDVGGEGGAGENGRRPPGAASPRTSVMKACVPRSMPLAQETSGADPGAAASRSRHFAARLRRRRHQNRVAPHEIVRDRTSPRPRAPERRREADRCAGSPRGRACAPRPDPTGRRLGPRRRPRWRAPCPMRRRRRRRSDPRSSRRLAPHSHAPGQSDGRVRAGGEPWRAARRTCS